MPKLSVVVITHNEERNIGTCLKSVKDIADDIVVVDSFSTDNTESICRKHNVNFYQHEWEGYSTTKNYANSLAKHDWILSLDADEALSEELYNSILKLKEGKKKGAYEFNRLTNYCGKWVKHCGWYPDTKIRIFDRRTTSWQGIIHETLLFQNPAKIIHLKGDCLHYSYHSLEQHLDQTEKFSTLAAKALFKEGKKATWGKLYISPAVKFFQDYIIKLGFLDGATGFTICKISAYTTMLKYQKLKKMQSVSKQKQT